MKPLYILALLLFTGCTPSSPSLSVRTLYGLTTDRPSVRLDTPDPVNPLLGRQHILSIDWKSPDDLSPTLGITLYFEDRTLIVKTVPLNGTWGKMDYIIDPALFRDHGSLLSYKIVLMHGDKELASSQHKLWVTPLEIKDTPK